MRSLIGLSRCSVMLGISLGVGFGCEDEEKMSLQKQLRELLSQSSSSKKMADSFVWSKDPTEDVWTAFLSVKLLNALNEKCMREMGLSSQSKEIEYWSLCIRNPKDETMPVRGSLSKKKVRYSDMDAMQNWLGHLEWMMNEAEDGFSYRLQSESYQGVRGLIPTHFIKRKMNDS